VGVVEKDISGEFKFEAKKAKDSHCIGISTFFIRQLKKAISKDFNWHVNCDDSTTMFEVYSSFTRFLGCCGKVIHGTKRPLVLNRV
jgi:hypothetical protein